MTACGRFDSHVNVEKRCRTRFTGTETVGNYISSKIIAEVKQTRMLVSNKEKPSLLLYYVNNIQEELVSFCHHGEERTGTAIKEIKINSVYDLVLSVMEKLILVRTSHTNCFIHPCTG